MTETVIHVVEAFGGGVFASVSQTCNGLALRGFKVHLVYSARDEAPVDFAKQLDPRIQLHKVSMVREINVVKDLLGIYELFRLFRSIRPDVIHLHSSKAGALGRVAARISWMDDRVFYSPRGLAFLREDVRPLKKSVYQFFEWFAALFGGHIVACSQSELDQVKLKIKPGRASLIENAIDVTVVPLKVGHLSGKVYVGTSGRISPQKSPLSFAELARRCGDVGCQFIWIGGGDDPGMVELLESAGVEVTGWLLREEAQRKLAELDVYVQTSLWEGMPISVIEAQVAGIPAVVTDVVGNRDVIQHGVTGFIATNEAELVKYTKQLIEDESLRIHMGEQARCIGYDRFNVNRLIDELVDLYSSVLPNRKVQAQ